MITKTTQTKTWETKFNPRGLYKLLKKGVPEVFLDWPEVEECSEVVIVKLIAEDQIVVKVEQKIE